MLIHETQTAGKARPFAFSLLDGKARTHLHTRWPNLGRRTIPPNSLIHESAYQRGGDYARHLPPMRSQQAEQGFRRFPPSAGRVMQCERSHSITVALRVIIGPKIGSFGHWQLSAGETCSP